MATRGQSFVNPTKFQDPRPICSYFPFNRLPPMDCPWSQELTPPLVLNTMLGISVLCLFIFILNFWNRNNEFIKESAKEFIKEKTQYSPPIFHFDTESRLGLVDQKRKWARSHGYEGTYMNFGEERFRNLAEERGKEKGEEGFEEMPLKNLKKTGKTVSWGSWEQGGTDGVKVKRSLYDSKAELAETLGEYAPYSAPDTFLRGVVDFEPYEDLDWDKVKDGQRKEREEKAKKEEFEKRTAERAQEDAKMEKHRNDQNELLVQAKKQGDLDRKLKEKAAALEKAKKQEDLDKKLKEEMAALDKAKRDREEKKAALEKASEGA